MIKRLNKRASFSPYLVLIPAALVWTRTMFVESAAVIIFRDVFIVLFTGCILIILAIPLTRTLTSYYLTQGVVILTAVTAISLVRFAYELQLIIIIIVILEIITYEPYPGNIIATIGATVIPAGIQITEFLRSGIVEQILPLLSQYLIPGVILAILGSLMHKYREIAVELNSDRNRLSESIVNLTRSNTEYLDYAMIAQEQGTEKERRRITRDIHDIVGYTLTNNMMLMEAALDLMKENPLALPQIITTARENAQLGLDQVRQAMYKLREQEHTYPTGMQALLRLTRIFEKATGITVQTNFANMPMSISDDIDSVIYHLIQEALVNTFRHGQATEISLSFWCEEHMVKVYILDNGRGSTSIKEGIGLQGMRERLNRIHGELEYGNTVNGFLLRTTIPI